MSLELIKENHSFTDSEMLNHIMKRQFPTEEYMSLGDQHALEDSGDIEIWALYDLTGVAGFTTLGTTDDMAYLFSLPLTRHFRERGLGKNRMPKSENFMQIKRSP